MFPKLDDAQIARLAPFGRQFAAAAGEVAVDQGESNHGVFVVLSGSLKLLGVSSSDEPLLRILSHREFSGEINMLSSRRGLIRIKGPGS
jgi:thioredoxin reductase (NADPH)